MKKGQKSTRGGYQDILFPMEFMNITQGNNGQFSHQGVNALDLAGKDTGRDLFYAPFDVKCVATGNRDTEGNAAFWQSCKKVRFADGTIDYATIMVLHDNSLDGIYPGATYMQGTQIGQEGTAGYATGNHNHFEIAKGKFTHKYDQNKYGVYHLPNSISAEKCCFVDDTVILNGNGMKWKKLADVKVNSQEQSKGKVDQILKVGEYFVIEGVHRVDQVLPGMDSIWCKELTGDGGNSIQAEPLTKCDKNGKETKSQTFSVGDYWKCTKKFKVLDVDVATNAVQANVGGRKIWLYAGPLREV